MNKTKFMYALGGVLTLHFLLWLGAFEYPIDRGSDLLIVFVLTVLCGFLGTGIYELKKSYNKF